MKYTMNISCIQAKSHLIDFMATDISSVYLATGHGVDVRIWKGDVECCMFLPALLCIPLTRTHTCHR